MYGFIEALGLISFTFSESYATFGVTAAALIESDLF